MRKIRWFLTGRAHRKAGICAKRLWGFRPDRQENYYISGKSIVHMPKVTLTSFEDEKKQGVFSCQAFNSRGKLLLRGEAKILFPKVFEV
jgi:hypothetical protein